MAQLVVWVMQCVNGVQRRRRRGLMRSGDSCVEELWCDVGRLHVSCATGFTVFRIGSNDP